VKVVAIGDHSFTTGFALIGVDTLIAKNEKEVLQKIVEAVEKGDYGIILLSERYVDSTRYLRERILKEKKGNVIFAFLPDYTGIKGKRIKELKEKVSRAIGLRIEEV